MLGKTLLAGTAVIGAAVMGLIPPVSTGVQLLAAEAPAAFYLRGSNVGYVPPEQEYAAWTNAVITDTAGSHQDAVKVDYSASFWPISHGGLNDPTWDVSVADGVASLSAAVGGVSGAIVYGYSQGAVVASIYMGAHPGSGSTFVLVANLNRPNGGLLARFTGFHIPFFNFTFNGATPATGDTTYDIARQYDGWADFPKYPLNLLATANALLGILYIHGDYDSEISPADLNDPTKTDKQVDPETNATYYLIHTDRLPLLMPFEGFVPAAILDALDPPLRTLVELGYDRTDYGAATGAELMTKEDPIAVATPTAVPAKTTDDEPRLSATKARRSETPQSKAVSAPHGAGAPGMTKRLAGSHSATRTRPARVPSQQSHPGRSDRVGTGTS